MGVCLLKVKFGMVDLDRMPVLSYITGNCLNNTNRQQHLLLGYRTVLPQSFASQKLYQLDHLHRNNKPN
jgi:hypothetical protein